MATTLTIPMPAEYVEAFRAGNLTDEMVNEIIAMSELPDLYEGLEWGPDEIDRQADAVYVRAWDGDTDQPLTIAVVPQP